MRQRSPNGTSASSDWRRRRGAGGPCSTGSSTTSWTRGVPPVHLADAAVTWPGWLRWLVRRPAYRPPPVKRPAILMPPRMREDSGETAERQREVEERIAYLEARGKIWEQGPGNDEP